MIPIRRRLTLFNAISLLIIAILLLIGVLAVLGVSVQDIVENSTRQRANEAARVLASTGGLSALEEGKVSNGDVSLVAFDANGSIVYREGDDHTVLDGYPGQIAFQVVRDADANDIEYGFDSQSAHDDPRLAATLDESFVFAVPAPDNDLGIVVFAATRSYDAVSGSRFGNWVVGLGVLLIVLLVIIVIASHLITRAALKPIYAFAASADAISESDMSRRFPVGDSKRNELDGLARTFSGLLGRLQSAFQDREIALEEQRQFAQDASHELRTPLTSILVYTRML